MRRSRSGSIAQEWLDQVRSKRSGRIEGEAGRMYYQDFTIYSYGSHFPMAHILTKDDKPFILVNADVWGSYTSRHQSEVQSAVRQSGIPFGYTPFSALQQAGVDPLDSGFVILDTTGDRTIKREYKGWNKCFGSPSYPCEIAKDKHQARADSPGWGSRYAARSEGGVRFHYVETEHDIHLMGDLLFRVTQVEDASFECPDAEACGDPALPFSSPHYERYRNFLQGGQRMHSAQRWTTKHFISGIDETARSPWRGFFLTELVSPVSTVKEALDSMAPESIHALRAHGDTSIVRQGEWFFSRAAYIQRDLDRILKEQDKAIKTAGNPTRQKEIEQRIDEIAFLTGQRRYGYNTNKVTRENDPVRWTAIVKEYEALCMEQRELERAAFAAKEHHMALLPARGVGRQSHRVTRLIQQGDTMYAKGWVRHTSGDHSALKLGDGETWYEVHPNVQVRSWSVGNGQRRANVD